MSDVYTASTVIHADPDRVFEYVRVPENQPQWATNFVRSTRPTSSGRYVMETPAGSLAYRVEADPSRRTVDFVFESPNGDSILPTRVVRHPAGATFMFTINRFPGMDDEAWERGRRGLDEELEQLKQILEA